MIYDIHTYDWAFEGMPISAHFKDLGLLRPVFKHPTEATVIMIDHAFASY